MLTTALYMARPVPSSMTTTPNMKMTIMITFFTVMPFSLVSLRYTAAGNMKAMGVAVKLPYIHWDNIIGIHIHNILVNIIVIYRYTNM